MKISQLLQEDAQIFSFEFFPPKSLSSGLDLGLNVAELIHLEPSFVSVTYGAGGSTQDASFELLDYLQNRVGLNCMAHYTCVGANKAKIDADMDKLYETGIRNLMLLRGDPPKGSDTFVYNEEGFNYGSDLVTHIRKQDRFCLGAGAYPEGHVESESLEQDLQHLLIKYKAGADFLVTQMFFDNHRYFDFLKKARAIGIDCPIIPGLIPIINYKQIKRFAKMSGASIPEEIAQKMEPYQDNKDKMYQIGVDMAIEQANDLLAQGVPGLHFYTLNKCRATLDIYSAISKPDQKPQGGRPQINLPVY